MKRSVLRLLLLGVSLVVGVSLGWGCAPAAAPAPTATPVPKIAPTAAPEAKPTPPPKAAWEVEWEQAVAAAKREGKVVVLGPPGAEVRKALVDDFQKAFPGIVVEFTGGPGGTQVSKLMKEREARQYLADVYIGGPSPAVEQLVPAGGFDPLEPALILPDSKDPKKWFEGKLSFIDKEKQYYMAFGRWVTDAFFYDSKQVDPKEFASYWDLTKPKWKGKIIFFDPTVPGEGTGRISFYYSHPDLGEKFLRALLNPDHGVTFTRDSREVGEAVARGKYAIGIGLGWLTAGPLIKELPNLVPMPAEQMKEGGYTPSGFDNVALMNRAPHPNAAKVFINWLLSKEGQTSYSLATGDASARLDVSKAHIHPGAVPKEGVNYMRTYEWEILKDRTKATELVNQIVAR